MKLRIYTMLFLLILALTSLTGCTSSKDETLKKVTLNEVAHSIFYAPQYVAIELGYFEEEGIDLELVTGFGADKVMTALVSGDADLGLMGSESSIYVYNQGSKDYVINFAQLTQRAGNFLVSREKNDHFSWSDVKGKKIIGGRKGGMPQMILEYILRQQGIDSKTDLSIEQGIDFGSTAAAFSGGQGDYSMEFEPAATALELQGDGYVVASLGIDSGYVPYTSYSGKASFLKENPELVQGFTNALQKGVTYVSNHTPEQIAAVIQPHFKEIDLPTIIAIVKRYHEQDTWKEDLILEEESFTLLQNILKESGELEQEVPYEILVDKNFSQKAFDLQKLP